MQHRLKEVEVNFERANETLEKKNVLISKLLNALTGAEDANQTLSIELEEARGKHELEVGQLRDQVLELQGLVTRKCEEIEQLKIGEGLDLEVFIDSDVFADIKDSIEDATSDELIRRIKEVHPDIDLTFLTVNEMNTSPNRDNDQGTEKKLVDPKEADPNTAEPTTDNQDSVSPWF